MTSPIATISLRLTPSLGKKSSLAAPMIMAENFSPPLLQKRQRQKRRRNSSLISRRPAVSPRVAPELTSHYRTDPTTHYRVLLYPPLTQSSNRSRDYSNKYL